jgi:hypothetical protein
MKKIFILLGLFVSLSLFGQASNVVYTTHRVVSAAPSGGGTYESILIADDSVKAFYIADASSITESAGEVTEWRDTSGNNVDLTEGSLTPNWAGDSVYFDGTASERVRNTSWTQTQPYTVIAVLNAHTWTDGDTFFNIGNSGGAGNTAYIQGASSPRTRISSASSIFSTAGTPALNTRHVATLIGNGASSSLQINQNTASTGDIGSRSLDQIYIGGLSGGSADFSINELIIIGGTKTAQWVSDIQDSLATKYSITF